MGALSWAASSPLRQSTSITHELVNLNLKLLRHAAHGTKA
jgi:hypothetical protein